MEALDQLEPLITAPPISWWPLAFGWWILLGLFFILIIVMSYFVIKKQRTLKKQPLTVQSTTRQLALIEWNKIKKPQETENANQWLQEINNLLKRICLTEYPEQNSQILMKEDWLVFLESHCPASKISHFTVLIDGAYQSDCYLNANEIENLNSTVNTWIEQYV